jgi:uncharacterized protein YjbI with pentapeptide repeats
MLNYSTSKTEIYLPHPPVSKLSHLTATFQIVQFVSMLFSIQFSLLRNNVHYATLCYSTLLYTTLRYYTLLYATLRYSTLLYATLRYSTLLYATLRYSTLLYATLRYSTLPTLLSSAVHNTTSLRSTLSFKRPHQDQLDSQYNSSTPLNNQPANKGQGKVRR